jgi:hypothetical protein
MATTLQVKRYGTFSWLLGEPTSLERILVHLATQFRRELERSRCIKLVHHHLHQLHLISLDEGLIGQQLFSLLLIVDRVGLAGDTFFTPKGA